MKSCTVILKFSRKKIIIKVGLDIKGVNFPQEFSRRLARMDNFISDIVHSNKKDYNDVLDYAFARYVAKGNLGHPPF